MRKPLSIDGDMARRFLDLLGPRSRPIPVRCRRHSGVSRGLLAISTDDNQKRAKASLKAGKPPWADHRHGSIDDQLVNAARRGGCSNLKNRPATEHHPVDSLATVSCHTARMTATFLPSRRLPRMRWTVVKMPQPLVCCSFNHFMGLPAGSHAIHCSLRNHQFRPQAVSSAAQRSRRLRHQPPACKLRQK
jgi:hypothetical protein